MIRGSKPGKKIFATPAYLREVDPGTFALFRDIVEEGVQPNGELIREKIKDMKTRPEVYRRAQPGEEVVMRTVHPKTGEVLELVVADGG